ncbi:MAG: choline-sulfatase, partial [Gaiellales bacterium]|nr:choline-sulfatase [Gaiellales bacterium]
MVMIRRGRHKYIRCPADPDLLYDLDADPSELHNLADQPEGVAVAADLRAESDRRWDLAALEQRVLESQRERHLVARALGQGAYTPWDFQPFSDASFQYVRSDASRGRRPGRGRPAGGLPPSSTGV